MKWTGGSKEALKNRKRAQGDSRFAGTRKRIDDVFFARAEQDENEALDRPPTARRVQTSLASISQWSQAAGLVVPSVDRAVGKVTDDENAALANADLNTLVSSRRRPSNVSLPKTTFSEVVSPEQLLQSYQFHQTKQSASQPAERLFIKKNFETEANYTQVSSNQSARSELIIGRIAEPVSMQPSGTVLSPTSFTSSKVAKDRAHLSSEKYSSPGKTVSKCKFLDDDVRVEFSPGKNSFFASSRPENSKKSKSTPSFSD